MSDNRSARNIVLDVVKQRRSVRDFAPTPVPQDIVDDILESGRWAPSGSNIQPWLFCVIRDEYKLSDIGAFSPGLIGGSPLLVVLCVDEKTAFEKAGDFGRLTLSVMDVSMAAQNMMLAAASMGLGSCIIKSFNAKGVAKLLKLPEHIRPELILALGYPNKVPTTPKKKGLSDIVFYDEWKEAMP